jgi:hypothetical protein
VRGSTGAVIYPGAWIYRCVDLTACTPPLFIPGQDTETSVTDLQYVQQTGGQGVFLSRTTHLLPLLFKGAPTIVNTLHERLAFTLHCWSTIVQVHSLHSKTGIDNGCNCPD